ncbi:hypothetical protein HQ865_22730 [Mucilaginibacter mali]|uniref:Uncharacterized protein n=1 Tax=Mucilaginibacter mali TaxID=2740462 RepID=A0A7D4UDC2_9SPHI|nr:hypothetical protein [Mucilaginibacter mali]QKJ32458.1 hypothetical protein HQ865_22730 [Mucilaginibacter mali]
MRYIIPELYGGPEYAAIVTDTDGRILVFEDRPSAEVEAADCQSRLIIEVD